MELEIIRTYYPNGTNGRQLWNGIFQCFTIELPKQASENNSCCIPEGRYRLVIRHSAKHRIHFMLENIKGREEALLYAAQVAHLEKQPCIAPVMVLTGGGTGLLSQEALDKLKRLIVNQIKDAPVFLTIRTGKLC